MKQIVGVWVSEGNRQRGPVRSYVLYFERLTGWAAGGQGAAAGPVREGEEPGVHWSESQIETGVFRDAGRVRGSNFCFFFESNRANGKTVVVV